MNLQGGSFNEVLNILHIYRVSMDLYIRFTLPSR